MQLNLYSHINQIPKDYLNQIKIFDIEGLSSYFNDPFTFNIGIALDPVNDKVLGVGIVRVINEFKMALDFNLSDFAKAKIIKEFISEGFKQKQCNEVAVEISKGEEHYVNFLKNHFGFKESQGPVLLVGD